MTERRYAVGLMLLVAACARQEAVGNDYESVSVNVPVEARAPKPAAPASREPLVYTSLKAADCRLIEADPEEAGSARHSCPGLAGYVLETSESDLRQDVIVVTPDGKRTELGLSSLVAKGAFNALGEQAEWRGTDATKPGALIVRLGVGNGAEPEKPDTSNLVVIRLAPETCVVAVIPPGPGQNEAARDKADGPPAPCLKEAAA